MQNLSLKELTLICLKILLRIINDNKGDKKSFFKWKKEETKKSLYKPTRNSLFKLKREWIEKSLNKPAKKNLFK